MNAGTAALADNPFPLRLPDLGVHGSSCAGPEQRDGYIAFADRPDPRKPSTAGWCSSVGARTSASRCWPTAACTTTRRRDACWSTCQRVRPHDFATPADCLAGMRAAHWLPGELRAALREVRAADAIDAHHELGRALAGRRFAARLPNPDPSLRPAAVAERVLDYARAAAGANSSVYIVEFPYWEESEWHRVGRTSSAARTGRSSRSSRWSPSATGS